MRLLVCTVVVLLSFFGGISGSGTGNGKLGLAELKALVSSEISGELLDDFWEHRTEFALWVTERMGDRGWKPKSERAYIDCGTCRAAVKLALDMIKLGMPIEAIENSVIFMCKALNIISDEECELLIHLIAPPILHILVERSYLTVDDFCGIMLQEEYCGEVRDNLTNWVIDVDENKPPYRGEFPLLSDSTPTAKILQFTDVHLNLGDVNCDGPCPVSKIEHLFMDAYERHSEAKVILLTGDYVDETFTTNETQNIQHFEAISSWIYSHFPSTLLLPVIGNHEAHPWNMFPPRQVWDQFDLSWMYNSLWTSFGQWIPSSQEETFRRAGYYTLLYEPGLRFVVLNNNLCYIYNFWLAFDTIDPEGQLQWFADTMQEAERAGERVILVGHLSPGLDDCWWPWNRWFNSIMDRYQHIIVSQFHGHTHKDEFKIFFDQPKKDSDLGPRPSSTLFIGAPATPYGENPGYKVYYADGVRADRTWEILDHETYHADLSQWVENGTNFRKLYGAREDYGLESLRPFDLYDFVVRMGRDDTLFQKYYRHYYVARRESSIPICDSFECRMGYLCAIVTSNSEDDSHCQRLHGILNGTLSY